MFKLFFVGPFQMGGGHAKPEIRVLEAERRRRLTHLRAEEFPGGCAGEAEFGQNLAAAADPAAGFGDGRLMLRTPASESASRPGTLHANTVWKRHGRFSISASAS